MTSTKNVWIEHSQGLHSKRSQAVRILQLLREGTEESVDKEHVRSDEPAAHETATLSGWFPQPRSTFRQRRRVDPERADVQLVGYGETLPQRPRHAVRPSKLHEQVGVEPLLRYIVERKEEVLQLVCPLGEHTMNRIIANSGSDLNNLTGTPSTMPSTKNGRSLCLFRYAK